MVDWILTIVEMVDDLWSHDLLHEIHRPVFSRGTSNYQASICFVQGFLFHMMISF